LLGSMGGAPNEVTGGLGVLADGVVAADPATAVVDNAAVDEAEAAAWALGRGVVS